MQKMMILKPLIQTASLSLLMLLCLGGCVRSEGVLFPPPPQAITWPEPPDAPRIRYVGQLTTSDDLKPAIRLDEAILHAVFGARSAYSMLSPIAICTDGADRVFVCDSGAQLVHVFDLKSRKYARWTPAPPAIFSQPVGIAWAPSGRLYVSDSVGGCIHQFDNSGNYLGRIGDGLFTRPAGIAFDSKTNRLLVADVIAHRIVAISPEGKMLQTAGGRGTLPGEFNFPTNLAIQDNRIFVSDTLNFRVQQLDMNFKPQRSIGQKGDMPGCFSAPKGIALDSKGHLYVMDAHFEAVQIFDNEGRLLLSFGEEGHGPGEFWLPVGIFIDRDRIWVADSYNRRVQVFDYLPENAP